MFTSRKKISKDNKAEPTEFEETVAQVILLFLFRNNVNLMSSTLFSLLKFCIFYGFVVPVWFGEHQSWPEEWLERSLHKPSNVRIKDAMDDLIDVCLGTNLLNMKTWFFLCSQVDVAGNRKAVVIYVPYRLRKSFRKIHPRLVRELEKKFSGKVVWYSCVFNFLFHASFLLLLSL